jgi:hypothetical protein
MASRISFVPLSRSALAGLPARGVVSTGGATHHDPLALEVQDRFVASKPAQPLAEARERPGEKAAAVCASDAGSRELLGIIGHHERKSPVFSGPQLI